MFFFDIIFMFISVILLVICVLVGVAFLTLLERKVLGYIQIRKGPNKVGYMGILQPFCEAIKLFSKEQSYPLLSNYIMFYYSPIMSLFLSLIMWMIMPYMLIMFSFNLSILFLLCCMSLGVYTIMIAGWSSNSSYSLLGGLRAIAQTISYEVSLVLILMSFLLLINSFSLIDFFKYQKFIWMLFMSIPLMLVWFVSSLAETNRTPFDFAEGESELVSGFNVEYSSGGFVMIFLSEYSMILLMSMLICVMFLGSDMMIMFYFKLVFISFIFIWVRGTFPRYRYDKLMYLAWKSFLSLSLNYLFIYVGLSIMIFSLTI